jgi:hypothetical protein
MLRERFEGHRAHAGATIRRLAAGRRCVLTCLSQVPVFGLGGPSMSSLANPAACR